MPRIHIGGPRNKDDADGGIPPGYLRESYLTIQNAIAYAMFEEKPSSVPKMQVAVRIKIEFQSIRNDH